MYSWRCVGWNDLPPTDLTFTMLISLSDCTDRSLYLMGLTEEANRDRANSLPMAFSLDLRTTIAFLLELDVSSLPSTPPSSASVSFMMDIFQLVLYTKKTYPYCLKLYLICSTETLHLPDDTEATADKDMGKKFQINFISNGSFDYMSP
jgi:hypothetical protein